MAAAVSESTPDESGINALILLFRFHGIAADPKQILHRFGGRPIHLPEMVLCAREFKLKARVVDFGWDQMLGAFLPAIAERKDGTFVVIAKAAETGVLIQDPVLGKPSVISKSDFILSWTGQLVLMMRATKLSDALARFDITWFVDAIYKYRRPLIEVLVASLFLQLFALATPIFFQVVTDKVLVHKGFTTLEVLTVALLTTSVFETAVAILRTYLFSHTTNRIDVELGARLFRHLFALPIAYFAARRTGQTVARVRELENIRSFLTGSALTLVIDCLFTVIFLIVMWAYCVELTLIVIGSIPLYVLLSVLVTPIFKRRLAEKFNRGAENQSFLVEAVTSAETLKSMAIEPQMQLRWEEQLAGYVQSSFRVLSLGNWASQAVQLIGKLVTTSILYFGALKVIGGDMTVGQLIAFNMLAGRVAQPILRIAQVWQDFQQTRISIDRVGDILNTTPEPMYAPTRAALPPIRGEISFDRVSFRYRLDGPPVLRDISLRIAPGQVVGIVGSSGSGKSTLTKLVQRLYVPEVGRVLVDGVDLAMIDASWLRRQVGVVLQENVLFNRTIRDNIALVDPATPMEQIVSAARLAGAHEFILELPEGYDTIVGERGASLSGGQRQRIAIARALIGNPRILIFDEATSALDYESERIIQENMRRIVQGRTVLIIAHRLTAVRSCDRILTLDRGSLVEDGSHAELASSGGRYASLLRVQNSSVESSGAETSSSI